jgi:hypothetical protein
MNADPRYFENALLNQISYREAIELAFWRNGHPPKNLTLQRKEIPICKVLYQPVVKGNKCIQRC